MIAKRPITLGIHSATILNEPHDGKALTASESGCCSWYDGQPSAVGGHGSMAE